MKTKSEILEKLKSVIDDVAIEGAKVTDKSRIIEDLGLDSMDYATVMLSVEGWSGIKINEDGVNWSKIQTVEQLADLFLANQS